MPDLSRELIAYAIVALMLAAGLPMLVLTLRRRRREKLRRRGIKRYGH